MLLAVYLLVALVGGLSTCTRTGRFPLPQAQELQNPVEKAAPSGDPRVLGIQLQDGDSEWEQSQPPPKV